jgi:hypothetical protein
VWAELFEHGRIRPKFYRQTLLHWKNGLFVRAFSNLFARPDYIAFSKLLSILKLVNLTPHRHCSSTGGPV